MLEEMWNGAGVHRFSSAIALCFLNGQGVRQKYVCIASGKISRTGPDFTGFCSKNIKFLQKQILRGHQDTCGKDYLPVAIAANQVEVLSVPLVMVLASYCSMTMHKTL